MSNRPAPEISEVFDVLNHVRKANGKIKLPPGHTSKWYFYGRVSHKGQMGDSPEAQESRGLAYWQMKVAYAPELASVAFGGSKLEPMSKSASKTSFSQRPAGRELVAILMPGDHLVVDKLDRLFRDRIDFAVTCDYLKTRGVKLHIVNWMGASIEMDTPMGDWILNSMANNAAFESAQLADRVRRARKRRRDQGLYAGLQIPWCCTTEGINDKNAGINTKRLIWHPFLKKKMAEVVMFHDQYELGPAAIARLLEKRRLMSGGEPMQRPYWTPKRVKQAYWIHKAIEAQGEVDPNRVKIVEFAMAFRAKFVAEHGLHWASNEESYGRPDPLPEPSQDDPDGIVTYTASEAAESF